MSAEAQRRKEHWWRTRADPYAEVWEQDVVPLLEADRKGKLQAKTIFEELEARYPGRFKPGQRRTLERHVREWRAVSGSEKEVFFRQEHPPGREGVFDFTHAIELAVRIAGELLVHWISSYGNGLSPRGAVGA